MNTLIVYASKYGTTEDCAKAVQAGLPGDVTLIDVNKLSADIALDGYDTVIIGGSVYVGAVSKKLRAFCNEYLDQLSGKRVGIFLCCAQPKQMDDVLTANFPPALVKDVVAVANFGCEAKVDKLKMLDKMIIKAVTGGSYTDWHILPGNIADFIRKISP